MSDAPFIRRSRMGDGPRVFELAQMALHYRGDAEMVRRLAAQAEEFSDDKAVVQTDRGLLKVMASVRVMDRGDGEVIGFSYCCPPLEWIMTHSQAPSFGVLQRLAASLVEVEMVAVWPQYRRQGIARRLLADCEERYRSSGYRLASVCVEHRSADLVSWAERQGYTFTRPGESAVVRPWSSGVVVAPYGPHTESQQLGVKPLIEGASARSVSTFGAG